MNKELYLCFAKQGELFFTERKAKDVMCTDWDKRFDESNPSFIKNEIYGCAKKIKIYRDYDYLFDKYNTIDCLSIDEVTLRGLGMDTGYLIGSCTAYELNNQQINDIYAVPWACIVKNGCCVVEELYANITYEEALTLLNNNKVVYKTLTFRNSKGENSNGK